MPVFRTFKLWLKRFPPVLRSIRFRLAVWFVFILGVVVVLFSAFIYTRQLQDLRLIAISRLEMRSQRLRAFLRFSGQEFFNNVPSHFPSDPLSGESLLQEGDILALAAPNGQVLQSWGAADAQAVNLLVTQQYKPGISSESFSFERVPLGPGEKNQKEYLTAFFAISSDERVVGYFLVGIPVDPANQMSRLLVSLTLGIILTLVIALVGGFWLADRAMRPVKIITQTAQTISDTDLSRRLHLAQKDELGELANTFDEMLNRLQSAFERQRQFTADASHELRTPLTIVDLETSRALEAQRSSQEYERALKVIHSENQTMIRMVNQLLMLARMDAGRINLQKEDLDLSDVSLEVVERLAPLAVAHGVRLSAGELPELPIAGDRQYLVQMLTNLVENAIKYTCGEGPHVQVETGSLNTEQEVQAFVRVIDNGAGILPEHLPHLFDRFYQVDEARARQEDAPDSRDEYIPSGAGLGLAIAQWIARAHGGEIDVRSEVGKGSVFEVTLPMIVELESTQAG